MGRQRYIVPETCFDQIKTLKKPNPPEVRRRPGKIRKNLRSRNSGFDLDRGAERLRHRVDEIRHVSKRGSPQRRNHRPILQADQTWFYVGSFHPLVDPWACRGL